MKRRLARVGASLAAVALLAAGCGGSPNEGEELTVYAAASLQEAFDQLLADFGAAHPEVRIAPAVYDGSSTLVTQLSEGATADVLATANEATMADAVSAGVMVGEPELFATNSLVIAVPADNPHQVNDLPDLEGLDFAICAEQVPCGAATVELFTAASFMAAPISVEQNVTAVANRVSAGDVDAGLIYTTDVAARPELVAITPLAAQVVNKYPIGMTSDSAAGAAFVEFVRSDAGAKVLAEFGFGQP